MLTADDALDREAIRATIATYNGATDRGDLAGVAACFTADGWLQIGRDEPIPRDEIVAVLSAVLTPQAIGRPTPAYVHHHVSSTRFTPCTDGTVRTDSYFAVFTQVGVDHWGRYRDVHAPDGGEWRIRSRQILTDGFSPQSLLRPDSHHDSTTEPGDRR